MSKQNIYFTIINFNDYETTEKLINNIKSYKKINKIIVVDNKSTDDSYEKLIKLKNKKIAVIQNSENKGYGSGINYGLKHIEKEDTNAKVIISNPDVEIDNENDLLKLVNNMDKDTAIIAPIIKEHEGLNKGWKIPTPLQDALMNIVYIHRLLRPKFCYYDESEYKKPLLEVEAVSGCFFVVDSQLIKQANYFDENVFLYYEENIIGKKIQNINKKIILDTEVSVFHNHSVSIDKSVKKINKYKILKNSQIYFQKTYNHANIFEIAMLFITNKITLLILHMVYFIKSL